MAKIAVTNIHDRLTSAWALADADVMIQCRKCGKTEIWETGEISGILCESDIVEHFEKNGWNTGFGYMREWCPDCMQKKLEKKGGFLKRLIKLWDEGI